ncbi:MAG: hypothetical protein U0807_15220 [Candidatus Binatia bacterium]
MAVAGQGDSSHRELGPIHLLKYVYLGDLAHAERHGGQTFTGAPWRFHYFGPWAEPVFARIEPAVKALEVRERRFPYNEADREGVRWLLDDARLADRLDDELPLEVASAIKRAIREYGNDTAGLLDYVYRTAPMLNAEPGEMLDFTVAEAPARPLPKPAPAASLSKSARKQQQAAVAALRERVQAKLRERATARTLAAPDPPPRYDAVFAEGQAWLDSLAGPPIEAGEGTVTFADDIWKSRGRRDPGIP